MNVTGTLHVVHPLWWEFVGLMGVSKRCFGCGRVTRGDGACRDFQTPGLADGNFRGCLDASSVST